MSKTSYKSDFLNVLTERGFLKEASDIEALDAKLASGVQSAYIGFDATAKSLHVGNLTGIMMLKWFQETGHKPITLMGGGTSKVGDPSFKNEQRKLMDDETINTNIAHIQATCFKQFLRYGSGKTDALMVNNNDWLANLNFLEFLRDYGRFFSVNRMLSFDSVKSRMEDGNTLSLLEFNYMVMQGYDFLELHKRYGTVLQMGGSDQWGNIINGVDLAHKSDRAQLFALTAHLLTTPDNKKMGKTEKGAVWLNKDMLSPYDYYQWWRNTDDAMVGTLLRRFTMLPIAEIQKLEALKGQDINDAKKILAFEATKLCHGETAANDAAATAQKVFEQGSVGDDLPRVAVDLNTGIGLVDAFKTVGFTASNSEARRLIEQGAARVNDKAVNDISYVITKNDLTADGYVKISSGKKKHALLTPA